jgi:pyruvate,orthophosphate dikinase
MNEAVCEHLATFTSERFALNIYATFLFRYSTIIMKIPATKYYKVLSEIAISSDRSIDHFNAEDLRNVIFGFKKISLVTSDPTEQLLTCIETAYNLWFDKKSMHMRDILDISENKSGLFTVLGVGIVVQDMIFGSYGVKFSRCPITGDKEGIYGDYFPSVGNRISLEQLQIQQPDLIETLSGLSCCLESHFKDMIEIDFVVDADENVNICLIIILLLAPNYYYYLFIGSYTSNKSF